MPGMTETLPKGITRIQDPGGRDALRLEGASGTVMVSLLGAQVLSFYRAGNDVLWSATKAEYAPGKPVRGGVPLVFPWFNEHATDSKLPAHGFVRNLVWRLASAKAGPEVVLAVSDDATTRAMWPHAFRLHFTVALSTTLRLALTVENTGTSAFPFEEALHTYFDVGDVHTASVHGLEGVVCREHAAAPEANWNPHEPLRFRAETDRIFQGVPDRLELRAPALRRTVTLTTANARSAIVWNPWPAKTARLSQMVADDWTRFCCIESANVRDHRISLAPGKEHTLSLTIASS